MVLCLLAAASVGCQEQVLSEKPRNNLFGRLQGETTSRSSGGPRSLDPSLLPPIREELPSGEVILRSRTARDLMVHVQRAVTARDRELERELFTEQVLSAHTWQEFVDRGYEPEGAYDELVRRREDVLKFFNRVGPLGENSPQVLMRAVGDNIVRLQLTGLAKEGLSWTFMDLSFEGGNWRLRWFGP